MDMQKQRGLQRRKVQFYSATKTMHYRLQQAKKLQFLGEYSFITIAAELDLAGW